MRNLVATFDVSTGVPKTRAEIIPNEPDADNAAEGRQD